MRLKLQKLQDKNEQAQKTKAKHQKSGDNIKKSCTIRPKAFYVPEIIWTELISRNNYDPLIDILMIF